MKTARRKSTARRDVYKPARSRRDVQIGAAAPICTNPAIAENVQESAIEVKTADFRKGMKRYVEGDQAVILGSYWRRGAIVIPMPSRYHADFAAKSEARARMHALLDAALDKL